ncbi:hypothetical protein, partial [Streptomyces sp. DSM 41534]
MQDSRQDTPSRGVFAGVDKTMAIASITMVFAFVLFSVLQPELANSIYQWVKQFIEQELGWYYILT